MAYKYNLYRANGFHCAKGFRRANGFTLTELIVVMVIIGILSVGVSSLIIYPVESYSDLKRRAELVDMAEMALQKMARDIRQALPNSIRTNSSMIEMLNTLDAGIYRYYPPPGGNANLLKFGYDDGSFSGDDTFTIYGQFQQLGSEAITALVINNTNNSDIYSQGSSNIRSSSSENYVITTPGTNITVSSGSDDTVNMDLSFLTPLSSTTPQLTTSLQGRRVFLSNGMITYKCESDQINRYSGHAINAAIGTISGGSGANLLSDHVDCTETSFTFDPGSAQRGAIATLKITLTDAGESVTLLHQIHVNNMP
ncbi:MAG: hypothetical protein DRQ43_00400 [Gammaproteobacteria bacterium]|nr:MAG: hypothetical protein DRQ43_00400 [Gammaproteobacteria bacterium]